MKYFLLFIGLFFFLQSCKLNSNNSAESTKPLPDVLEVNMDTTIKPSEDFLCMLMEDG